MQSAGDPRRPWTANALAEELPCSADTVYNRLRELETLGHIKTKKVGSRARIWWLPDTENKTFIPDTDEFGSSVDTNVINAMATRSDPAEGWTTGELAEKTPHSQDSIYNRLRVLQEKGYVESEKVGSRARVWWLPTESDHEMELDA